MSESRQGRRVPEGKTIPLVYEGLDDLPVMFANQFLVQSQQSEFIVAFGQQAPPLILPGTEEERRAQVARIHYVPVRMLARFGLTEERFRELIALMTDYLKKYDERKAKESDASHDR
jgi:hypothetical protein